MEMAPSSSQKGTGKKAGSAASAIRSHQQHSQQQRSRNTTPGPAGIPPTSSTSVSVSVASLPPIETVETETLDLRFDTFRNVTFEDLVDPAAASALIPDSKSLDGIISRLQRLADIIEKRGANCDRGMRLLAQTRRQRLDELAVERGREEERRQAEADDEKKANKKKRKADSLAPGAVNTGWCLAACCLTSSLFVPSCCIMETTKQRKFLLTIYFRTLLAKPRINQQSPKIGPRRHRKLLALPRCCRHTKQHGRRRQG